MKLNYLFIFFLKKELLATCGWKNFWKIEDFAVCWWIWAVIHMVFHLLLGQLPVRQLLKSILSNKRKVSSTCLCFRQGVLFISVECLLSCIPLYLLWKRLCILFRPLLIRYFNFLNVHVSCPNLDNWVGPAVPTSCCK